MESLRGNPSSKHLGHCMLAGWLHLLVHGDVVDAAALMLLMLSAGNITHINTINAFSNTLTFMICYYLEHTSTSASLFPITAGVDCHKLDVTVVVFSRVFGARYAHCIRRQLIWQFYSMWNTAGCYKIKHKFPRSSLVWYSPLWLLFPGSITTDTMHPHSTLTHKISQNQSAAHQNCPKTPRRIPLFWATAVQTPPTGGTPSQTPGPFRPYATPHTAHRLVFFLPAVPAAQTMLAMLRYAVGWHATWGAGWGGVCGGKEGGLRTCDVGGVEEGGVSKGGWGE